MIFAKILAVRPCRCGPAANLAGDLAAPLEELLRDPLIVFGTLDSVPHCAWQRYLAMAVKLVKNRMLCDLGHGLTVRRPWTICHGAKAALGRLRCDMSDRKARIKRYRNKAEEARVIAESTNDEKTRQFLKGVAADYVLLADALARQRDDSPAPDAMDLGLGQ